jgi:hypothetical protein
MSRIRTLVWDVNRSGGGDREGLEDLGAGISRS